MIYESRLHVLLVTILVVSTDFGNSYVRRHGRRENNLDKDVSNEPSSHKLNAHQLALCWMTVNSTEYFELMDKLDETYANVLKEYQDAAEKDMFDEEMLKAMLKTRGAAEREVHNVGGHLGLIPAGINLGGYFMMRMPNSLLFFHRMKLRNNTHFRVLNLHSDLVNFTLHARLSLNDLHLVGSYDRSTTDKDPSILFYTPTHGQVEFLLKNVQFSIEGRYRLLKDRLTIVLIISEIEMDDVMMTYLNNGTNESIRLQRKNIDDFLIHLKSDLNKWLKDYFNDYLMYFGLVGKASSNKLQQYDKERALVLNDYTDYVLSLITSRIHEIKAESVILPKFTIFTANNMELLLRDGVLRGLDSMYRRSVATGKKEENIRKVDAIVGFSNLKVTYQYEALLATDSPVLRGMIILSADELITRMQLVVTEDSDSADIQFEFLEQAKPEALTIEGPANRVISNFKYLLEQHIIAIMTNILHYNIKILGSLTRCVPLFHGHQDNLKYGRQVTNPYNKNKTKQSTPRHIKKIVENTTNGNSEPDQPEEHKLIEFETSPVPVSLGENYGDLSDIEIVTIE